MNSQLVAIAGPRRGATLPVPDLEVSIGRDADNWLVIESDGVSRRHCVLRPGPDGVTIADLDSLNGTFVNGVPVKQRLLEQGERDRAGRHTIAVRCSGIGTGGRVSAGSGGSG